MGWLHRAGTIGPIGLDLGAHLVKAVQLRHSADGWRLIAAASIPRASGAPGLSGVEAQRIRAVLDRRGFRGNEIVVAVPNDKLLTANLELPLRNPQMPFEQIARQEFARSVKQDMQSFEFAFWDLPLPARAAKATHVLAVGCTTAQSEPMLEGFDAAGFSVCAIDVEACALARACAPLLAPPEQITAILEIGWSSSRLSIVHRGIISYCRRLAGTGISTLRQSMAQQLELPDEVVEHLLNDGGALSGKHDENGVANQSRRAICAHADALIGEVTTSLSYAAHQYPDAAVSRVLLAGGGTMIPGISDYFAAQLGMDVRRVTLGDVLAGNRASPVPGPLDTVEDTGAEMLVAAGLAQHQESKDEG